MNRQSITCRIRFKDGKYEGTMKYHTTNTDESSEKEIVVRDGIDDNEFVDMGLTLQGKLITERCVIMKDSFCEVVVDKNEYLGFTDYEIEIEYEANHEKAAQSILQTLRDRLKCRRRLLDNKDFCQKHKNIPSKSERFFEKRMSMSGKSSFLLRLSSQVQQFF